MKIAVCVKQVPGTSEVEIDAKTGVLKREGIDSKMNPYDLFALEAALKIKEENGAKVTVISMGPPQASEIIREAYMMGADEGVLLSDRRFAGADVLSTAYTISQGIKKLDGFDLVICGKQTTDGDTAQVGPELAEFLNIPHATNVKRMIHITDHSLIVEIDLPHTVQNVEIPYPCLIAVDKDINQPRLPSFRRKLASHDRPVVVYSLEHFSDQDEAHYGLNGSPTRVLRIFTPESNSQRQMWHGTGEELARRLVDKLTELKFL